MGCNWCPCCEDRAEDYYEEWYNPREEGGEAKLLPTDVPDNQLCFPFIMDEIGIPKIQEIESNNI